MRHFFFANADFKKNPLIITDPLERHHIHHVLRLKEGARISVFNGKGGEAVCEILKVSPVETHLKVLSLKKNLLSSSPRLVLACAIPKKAKMETIIEKATELGVDEVIPLLTKRTEVRWLGQRATKKRERFYTVAVNAAKQSKRATVPLIHPPIPFKQALEILGPQDKAVISCLEGPRKPLLEILKNSNGVKRLVFLIGPEGDFTQEELTQARQRGCVPVSLGPTVLKVDTAAITVMAAANLLYRGKT